MQKILIVLQQQYGMHIELFRNHILRILLFKIGYGLHVPELQFLINLIFLRIKAATGKVR
jgi:hypothetical protein